MKNGAKKTLKVGLLTLAAVVVVGGGYMYWQSNQSKIPAGLNMGSTAADATPITKLVAPETNAPTKTFNLTAEVATVNLGNGKTTQAWTFNGTAPGPELRVQQGDRVVVHLTNKLPEGVTIHWHGVDVPGAEDGIAGVTQDAIKPGQTYTYTFIANEPGTYWYHSHQDSSNEVERGLYGVLVVEPKNPTVTFNEDYSVALHEWNTTGSTNEGMGGMNMSGSGSGGMNMSGSDSGGMNTSGSGSGSMNMSGSNAGSKNMSGSNSSSTNKSDSNMSGMDMSGPVMMPNVAQSSSLTEMMTMYDVYTTNGTSEGLHLAAKPGDLVRLRLVNTGNMTHLVTLEGAKFQVVSMDGHDITGPTPIENTLLPIGAAERYDISFTMPQSGSVKLVDADPSSNENKMISVTVGNGAAPAENSNLKNEPWFDFSKYGTATTGQFTLNTQFTKTYNMTLGAGMGFFDGKYQMVYTINGKVFPNISPLKVDQGDIVKVHIENQSNFTHPMHLHGHFFQVLSRNGKPLSGSPVYLDTINVLPGESYDIAFKADNPGLWMFHCHDLHHAAAGMDTMVQYNGISTPFTFGQQSDNNPE